MEVAYRFYCFKMGMDYKRVMSLQLERDFPKLTSILRQSIDKPITRDRVLDSELLVWTDVESHHNQN